MPYSILITLGVLMLNLNLNLNRVWPLWSESSREWYTYDYSEGFLQILGSSFLTIGFLKLFHALSFPGMPQLITYNSESKTMLFWLLSRLFESVALLLSSFIVAKDYKISFPRWLSFGIALTVSGITLLGVSYGITFFTAFPLSKNTLVQSIFIVAILLIAMILFWLGSKKPLEKNFNFLISEIPLWKNEFLFGEEGDMIDRQFTGQIK